MKKWLTEEEALGVVLALAVVGVVAASALMVYLVVESGYDFNR